MLEKLLEHPVAVQRMRAEHLGPHLDGIAKSIVDLGYARSTARTHLWLIADFSRWLARLGVSLADVDEDTVARFQAARRRKRRDHRSLGRAAHRVLDYLRAQGVARRPAPVDPASLTHSERLLERFATYLRTERAVMEATVSGYRSSARCFLNERFGTGALLLREITPADVSRHLLRQAQALPPGRARPMVTALRAFFRFLLRDREIEVDLSSCVLSVAQRGSSIPRYIGQEEVERLLRACDPESRVGRRDYAVLLLLARLGLRASEVLALELNDVDWRAGEITIPGKGNTRESLPLPHDVGAALAAYLRRDRPSCSTRRIFICVRAPHRGFANPSTVSTIVMRALERAGLRPPVQGAHLLRHSLATGMLRRGASLPEIGQVLRHRSQIATEVYAKVDFASLRSVAQPWPRRRGGQ